MDKKQGIVLFVLFAVYLIIGGAIFMTVENLNEEVEVNPIIPALANFKEFMLDNETLNGAEDIEAERLKIYLVTVYDNYTTNFLANGTAQVWSFYDAFFFCLTVVTTIGYGNIAPTTGMGRVFCVFYALIGIPLTGILMAGIGDFFSGKLLKAHEKTKTARSDSPRLSLVINTVTYLIPGLLLFLFLPAGIFMALEDWTYLEGFYYGFITLTTIGFGDYVAGTKSSDYQWLYKICLTIWITFGLGYLSMILNFMAKAMKSKHVKKLEASFTKISKQTQEALTKEIDVFKQAMNEFIANKMKSKSSSGSLYRSSSLPSLHRQPNSGVQRSTSSGSVTGEYSERTETSVNFIFDLAMALACTTDPPPGGEGGIGDAAANHVDAVHANSRKGSIAHLLSLALMGGQQQPPAAASENSAATGNGHRRSRTSRTSRTSTNSAFTELFAAAMRMGGAENVEPPVVGQANNSKKPRNKSRASSTTSAQRTSAALFESFLFPSMGVGAGGGGTSGGDGGRLDAANHATQRRKSDYEIYGRGNALEDTAKPNAATTAAPRSNNDGGNSSNSRRVERSVSQPVVKQDMDKVKERYHANGHVTSARDNHLTPRSNNNGSIDSVSSIDNNNRNIDYDPGDTSGGNNNNAQPRRPSRGHTVIPIEGDTAEGPTRRHSGESELVIQGVGGGVIYRPDCETSTPVIPEEKSDCESLVSGSGCGDEGDALMATGSGVPVIVGGSGTNRDDAGAVVVDMEVDSDAVNTNTTDDERSSATSGSLSNDGFMSSSEFLNDRLRSPYVRDAKSFITKM